MTEVIFSDINNHCYLHKLNSNNVEHIIHDFETKKFNFARMDCFYFVVFSNSELEKDALIQLLQRMRLNDEHIAVDLYLTNHNRIELPNIYEILSVMLNMLSISCLEFGSGLFSSDHSSSCDLLLNALLNCRSLKSLNLLRIPNECHESINKLFMILEMNPYINQIQKLRLSETYFTKENIKNLLIMLKTAKNISVDMGMMNCDDDTFIYFCCHLKYNLNIKKLYIYSSTNIKPQLYDHLLDMLKTNCYLNQKQCLINIGSQGTDDMRQSTSVRKTLLAFLSVLGDDCCEFKEELFERILENYSCQK